MGKVFAYILALLPLAIQTAEKVGKDLEGKQKKQMAVDIMTAAAQGVATVSPENTLAAGLALNLATNTIDGTVALFNEIGVFQKKPIPAQALSGSYNPGTDVLTPKKK